MTPEIDYVLHDSCTSHWVRDTLKSALKRDCVDAANDAELVAHLLAQRVKQILNGHQ